MTALIAAILCVLVAPAVLGAGGSPAGPEFRVNSYTTGDQSYPKVASDSTGNFVVVWRSYVEKGIFGQRYDASGNPLGGEFLVNTYTSGNPQNPAVARTPNGDFVVVWGDININSGIFGQRFAGTGAPVGGEFQVNTYTTHSRVAPAVAMDSSGNFIVAWQDGYQENAGVGSNGVFGRRFSSSGAPLGSEFHVNTYTPYAQQYASIAAASNGNFIVVWLSGNQDGSLGGIYGQRYASSGAPLGTEFRVNTYTTHTQTTPTVASDSSGNFVVAWTTQLLDFEIHGQRYASSGAPLGGEFVVNHHTNYTDKHPAVAADPSGNFVVVWMDGYDGFLRGQRFAGTGSPLGSAFKVNTAPSYEAFPAVSADAGGDFVVVWQASDQDGDSRGVYGQRYAPILPVELLRFTAE